jgi:hypothetical protein
LSENDEGIPFIRIYGEAEIFSQAIAAGHPPVSKMRVDGYYAPARPDAFVKKMF